MSFEEKYPRLASFLASYFPAGEFDYLSDEDVVRAEVAPGFGFEEVLEEGRQLLHETDFPWHEIVNCTSYAFKDAVEAHQWLSHLMALVEEELKE